MPERRQHELFEKAATNAATPFRHPQNALMHVHHLG